MTSGVDQGIRRYTEYTHLFLVSIAYTHFSKQGVYPVLYGLLKKIAKLRVYPLLQGPLHHCLCVRYRGRETVWVLMRGYLFCCYNNKEHYLEQIVCLFIRLDPDAIARV